MSSDREHRAQHRRATWRASVTSASGADDANVEFWSRATSTQKLDAIWQMAIDSLIMKGEQGPRSELQSSGGVRRR